MSPLVLITALVIPFIITFAFLVIIKIASEMSDEENDGIKTNKIPKD